MRRRIANGTIVISFSISTVRFAIQREIGFFCHLEIYYPDFAIPFFLEPNFDRSVDKLFICVFLGKSTNFFNDAFILRT